MFNNPRFVSSSNAITVAKRTKYTIHLRYLLSIAQQKYMFRIGTPKRNCRWQYRILRNWQRQSIWAAPPWAACSRGFIARRASCLLVRGTTFRMGPSHRTLKIVTIFDRFSSMKYEWIKHIRTIFVFLVKYWFILYDVTKMCISSCISLNLRLLKIRKDGFYKFDQLE